MNIIEIVLPIFLIIALGAFLGKIKKLTLDPYVFIIMYITAPALIISSLQKSEIQIKEFFLMALYTAIIVILLWLISTLLLKFLRTKQKGIQLPMIFGNSGYLGFPVTLFAFGVIGLSYAVIYSSIETIFLMSLGIFLASHKKDIKEIFKVPLIYAIIFALILNIINWKIPEFILTPIDMVGQITIPLALIVLGYRLTKIKIKDTQIAFLASIFKMGTGLILALILIAIFSITGVMKNVLIIIASMPSAVLTMVICHKYRRDADLVASVILISTLLSIITIPLILLFL
jgi:predicted permease